MDNKKIKQKIVDYYREKGTAWISDVAIKLNAEDGVPIEKSVSIIGDLHKKGILE